MTAKVHYIDLVTSLSSSYEQFDYVTCSSNDDVFYTMDLILQWPFCD